jgi:hypothetical protein
VRLRRGEEDSGTVRLLTVMEREKERMKERELS